MSESLAFYFDQTRCTACNACVVSCKDWNGVNQGPVSYRNVTTSYSKDMFPNVTVYNISSACNHCDAPACVTACGREAISKLDNGIVLLDRNKCVGLEDCITACPYGAIGIADDEQEKPFTESNWEIAHPAQKCHMCYDRIEDGKQPACVGACPQRALDVDTAANLRKKYGSIERYQDLGTGPNFYIKRRA